METYQTDLGLGVDDLGIKLHLFRSWIDKQSMDYIRNNYKERQTWISYWPTARTRRFIWITQQVLPIIIEAWETLPIRRT